MTTQLNEHQKTIQFYLSVLVGLRSQIKAGTETKDYLMMVANDINVDKIIAAMDWMLKAEVRE